MNGTNLFFNFILYDVHGVRKFTDEMKSIVFRWKIHIIFRALFLCSKITMNTKCFCLNKKILFVFTLTFTPVNEIDDWFTDK